MENIIKKVAEYPEEYRQIYGKQLANHLKMMYLTYNRDSVNDALIAHQISEISEGKISVPESFVFDSTKALLQTVNGNADFYTTPSKPT